MTFKLFTQVVFRADSPEPIAPPIPNARQAG
jgi:hypothetical protein